ncbi:MAG: hypothetical protein J6Z11_14895, partial [Candidatus Riflebacteria bacterium]|nr:hypothetical protein [Candidatus Riflebacteria bacterium]
KGTNKQQTSELFANKILYYPDEERTIAVGNVHATVYPGSDSGKSKDKDKKKKDENLDDEEIDDSLKDVPAGDFTEIGGDEDEDDE